MSFPDPARRPEERTWKGTGPSWKVAESGLPQLWAVHTCPPARRGTVWRSVSRSLLEHVLGERPVTSLVGEVLSHGAPGVELVICTQPGRPQGWWAPRQDSEADGIPVATPFCP